MAKSREESYFTNTSKTATVSKSFSIPNEEFSDDTTSSVARKFLNEKTLELEIDRLLRAIVSQEIMSIVQNNSVVDTSNLQAELERTKERFEKRIIKKETEYAKLWNNWHKKCEECEYDKISYDKAYNDMQQKIERLQAQLGDLKGKYKDTPGVSDTLDPLSQKLENENVELEFQVVNYVREIEHLKTTYKNLFDSISVTRTQTKSIIDSLQDKLHDTNYENAKLRAQLFDKASEQKDTIKGTSANTLFTKQSILGKPHSSSYKPNLYYVTPFPKSSVLPKVDKTNALSKPVTSNSVPITKESTIMINDNVITPGMFRIDPHKTCREDKFMPNNKVREIVRTNPIIVSQPHVITKKDVNSDSNGLSSIGVDNTAKTRRPQPRSNTKNDRDPSTSKSMCIENKDVEVEEHHRNLRLSKNKKHVSSECNNVKLSIRKEKSKIVCAMCKQCLITANHDTCMLNYVNDMNFRKMNQKENVSNTKNQTKQKPHVWKPKKVGSKEILASPKPRKPRTYLRWSPTGRIFDLTGKIIEPSNVESHSDCSNGDNAYTSNPHEPKRKWFPNSTFSLAGHSNLFIVRRLGMFKAHDRKSEASHKFHLEVLGNDLEVALRRNTYFVRNLEGVDLLKGNRTTNLYTINLHEMASASPICLMARATSTKSWLCVGISHQASFVRTPQQNGVVERRNRTLVEAARTMLIFSRAPLFLWAKAIATVCYTQNRSIIRRQFNKTPYELINGRKLDISFLHVFGDLCYPKNDREDIGKLDAKGDIGFSLVILLIPVLTEFTTEGQRKSWRQ
ncbi:retrovirus-related pol polyprotein from transposon TNT 1-94 [Tanacetum coccineum]